MTRRLEIAGDDDGPVRGPPVKLIYSGRQVRGFEGESVAAALFAAEVAVLGRSLKYHRPRSYFCLDGHCGGCLVRIDGEPNRRACMTRCRDNLVVEGQNAYPSPDLDLLSAVDWLFPSGMDHHTMMTRSTVLNSMMSRVVRHLSGLGQLPDPGARAAMPSKRLDVDVTVVGGGPAGLAAATTAARSGATVLLVDEQLELGGSLQVDPRYGPKVARERVAQAAAAGVRIASETAAIGFYPEDHGGTLAIASNDRLTRVHSRATIYATGGYSSNVLFENNDRPGVIAARAAGRLLVQHGIEPGHRICLARSTPAPAWADYTDALASALGNAGCEVLELGPEIELLRCRGRDWVSAIDYTDDTGSRNKARCDLVIAAALPAPASECPRQHGCEVELSEQGGGFAVRVDGAGRTSATGVYACGDVCGFRGAAAAASDGERVACTACEDLAT